jgi:very-short-patch-repair endonuclease
MEEFHCKFCGKSCKNTISLRGHERQCPSNPDRVYISYTKGLKGWQAGKTKETDIRLKEKGERLSEKFRSGELVPYWKGKHLSEETKLKISKSMIKAQKEGRAYNIGQCRWNNEHSIPEKWLIKVLKNDFNQIENIDYKTEMSFYRYALDFAWPEKKLCIEIDGKQHLYDEKQIARDKEKDRLLKDDGWKELRLKWGYIVKNTQEALKIITNFLNEVGDITIPINNSQSEICEEKRKENELNGVLKDKSGKFNKKKLSEDKWLKRKEIILNSAVDLTKFGWKSKIERKTELTRKEIVRTIEHFPDLQEQTYKRVYECQLF